MSTHVSRACGSLVLLAPLLTALHAPRADADSVTVAVASNFIAPLAALERRFEADSGHELTVVAGSTGQLYAQIKNGAPFDVFLSADQEHPEMLIANGFGDGTTRLTYAVGRLALWTRDADKLAPLALDSLRRTDYRWLAIANPELAPYGLAAQQALEKLGLWDTLQPRIVRGENIAQTFGMAETRNADLAFVALSQAVAYAKPAAYVEIPAELYEPIRQDAILLTRARSNAAALAFLAFLQTAEARELIERFGYAAPKAPAAP